MNSGPRQVLKPGLKMLRLLVRLGSDFDTVCKQCLKLIDYLRCSKTDDEDPENTGCRNTDSVKVATIHASKGLKFEAAFTMLWATTLL